MVLYVIPVTQPPAGADWLYTVPGQYLEHIVGITATLTAGNGAPPAFADSSGNGNDLTTIFANDVTFGVPGLLTGNDAVSANGSVTLARGPMTPAFLAADFSVMQWVDIPAAGPYTVNVVDMPGTGGLSDFIFSTFIQAGLLRFAIFLRTGVAPGNLQPSTASHAIPTPGRHLVTFTYEQATGACSFYLDDSAPILGVSIVNPVTESPTDVQIDNALTEAPTTLDDLIFWPTLLDVTDVAALYAAGLVDEASFAAAALAFAAWGYYKLDEFTAGAGRTVALEVTDGTAETMLMPTDFPTVSTPGPYAYSWQPNLNSSSQTPNGQVTTVAIPDLILPAGYTLGTKTPDLAATDQWADIFVWWSTDVMDASTFHNPYLYPPGATLQVPTIGVP